MSQAIGHLTRRDTPQGYARRMRNSLPETWGPQDDERLHETGGNYAGIAQLSREYHVAERALLARWLRIR